MFLNGEEDDVSLISARILLRKNDNLCPIACTEIVVNNNIVSDQMRTFNAVLMA